MILLDSLHAYPALFLHRAETVIPMLVAGFFFGEFIARYFGVEGAFALVWRVSKRWTVKLNKEQRGIATRLYRGLVAMLLLLIPVMVFSIFLAKMVPLANLLMVALYGRAFHTWQLLRRYRRARANAQSLELPERDFLFADSHAVLRYSILSSAQSFTVGVVGTTLWYLVGGLPCALTYLVLHEIAVAQDVPIFGWAANGFFRMVHFIPHLLGLALLTLAAIFVPRAKPLAVFKATRFHGFVAYLLHISLGGAFPGKQLEWQGTGTPKALPEHLARWLLVRLAATVLLIVLLATPLVIKLLKLI